MMRCILTFVFFTMLANGASTAQENFLEKVDLQSEWLTYTTNQFSTFEKATDPIRTIYFSVKPGKFKTDFLVISGQAEFSIFLNGKLLVDQTRKTALSFDSLQKIFPEPTYFFSIHGARGIESEKLSTLICSRILINTLTEETHPIRRTSFRDFVIVAVLILFVFLVSIIQLNPRLSSDYFSVTKLFSLRETDVDQFYYRLTSGNILFYLLISLALAFFMIVIGQFVEFGMIDLKNADFAVSMLTWLKVCLAIFVLLFIKMALVYIVASLFGIRDIAGFHFFNFTRLLLVSVGALTLILSVYNLLRGQQYGVYDFLLSMLTWATGGWVLLLFLKLTNRVSYAVFHLFSYICATEIIPFLLIVKALNE
jgi:Domain of unknown function (DUF4271)